MIFHKGETLRLVLTGNDIIKPPFPEMDPIQGDNKGKHIIRFGGQYESYLQLPVTKG